MKQHWPTAAASPSRVVSLHLLDVKYSALQALQAAMLADQLRQCCSGGASPEYLLWRPEWQTHMLGKFPAAGKDVQPLHNTAHNSDT